jgi:hypothetical protein
VLIVYDPKQACEAVTTPRTRAAPFKEHRYKRCILSIIEERSEAAGYEGKTVLVPGDVYLVFDGKRSGLRSALKSVFTIDKQKPGGLRQLHLIYSESGLMQRRSVTRKSAGGVRQNESLLLASNRRLKLPVVNRKHLNGTILGNTLTEVPLPVLEEQWCLSVARKRELYGSYRVPVGGKDPDDDDEDSDEDEPEDPAAMADAAKARPAPPPISTLPHRPTTERHP